MGNIKTILNTIRSGFNEDFASLKVPVFAMAIIISAFIGKATTLQSIVNQCSEPTACNKVSPEAVAAIAASLPSEWIQLAMGSVMTIGLYCFAIYNDKKEAAEKAAKAETASTSTSLSNL
jgi:hypothetical protein